MTTTDSLTEASTTVNFVEPDSLAHALRQPKKLLLHSMFTLIITVVNQVPTSCDVIQKTLNTSHD